MIIEELIAAGMPRPQCRWCGSRSHANNNCSIKMKADMLTSGKLLLRNYFLGLSKTAKFTKQKRSDNMTDGQIEKLANALEYVGRQIKYLGGGDNSDERGAIEVLAIAVNESSEAMTSAIQTASETIAQGMLDAAIELGQAMVKSKIIAEAILQEDEKDQRVRDHHEG